MSKAQELSGCPFCGFERAGVKATDEMMYVSYCFRCGSQAAICKSVYAAAEAWNNRPASSEQQAAQQDALELTPVRLEAAAKSLSESMDYPWEHMTDKGKAAMRKSVRVTLDAARASNGGKS